MIKDRFIYNLIYYNTDDGSKLKFIGEDREGFYHFKVLAHNDPDEDWVEYSTKDGSEIVKTKKELDEAMKEKESL